MKGRAKNIIIHHKQEPPLIHQLQEPAITLNDAAHQKRQLLLSYEISLLEAHDYRNGLQNDWLLPCIFGLWRSVSRGPMQRGGRAGSKFRGTMSTDAIKAPLPFNWIFRISVAKSGHLTRP